MFSEVVKLVPQIDRARLNSMFSTLSRRFGQVAKRFGQGMKNALKLAPLFAVTGAFLTKLLNPLQKAEEVIDRILNKGSSATVDAKDLGTDPGRLLRLQALAQAKGVDPETLKTLLGRFQAALAKEQEVVRAPAEIRRQIEAASDPREKQALRARLAQAEDELAKGGRLRQFVDEKDAAEAFFKFIQSVGKLEKSQQVVIQTEMFGERLRGRAADLFNSVDEFSGILARLPSAEKFAEAAKRADALSSQRDLLAVVRESEDFIGKSGLVNESQILQRDQTQRRELERENMLLRNYSSLKAADDAIDSFTKTLEKAVITISKELLPPLVQGIKEIQKRLPSPEESIGAFDSVIEKAAEASVAVEEKTDQASSDLVRSAELNNAFSDMMAKAIADAIRPMWEEFKTSRLYKFFNR